MNRESCISQNQQQQSRLYVLLLCVCEKPRDYYGVFTQRKNIDDSSVSIQNVFHCFLEPSGARCGTQQHAVLSLAACPIQT